MNMIKPALSRSLPPAALAFAAILVLSFGVAPLAFATASISNYPFELTGRMEYVAPPGTPNPFGNAVTALIFSTPVPVPVGSFSWVPASSYTTSPGHGL